MDPVSRFSLILLISILLSISIPTDSQSVKLSRRNLAFTDQAMQEQPTSVKSSLKKKKSLTDQDPKPLKSKNASSNDQDELEAPKPIKKKNMVSDDQVEKGATKPAKKKKQTTLEEETEEDPKPAQKKKLTTVEEETEDDPKPIKKKKLFTAEQEIEDDPKPVKKKKLSTAETETKDDQKPVKKKKAATTMEDENEDPKPVKKKKSSSTDQDEVKSNKKSILDSNSKNQPKPVKLKKTNSTSIPTYNSTKSKSSTKTNKINKPDSSSSTPTVKKTKPITSIWLESETDNDDSDLLSEFRDLPTQIQETFLPDLKKISITSKAYIYKANKNMEKNMKPFVGNKYAPKIALAASCVFLVLPLCLLTALFYQLNSYLSLQSFLIFIQAYLAIYFFTLAMTALTTGLEPLRFFYATSPSYYTWTQAVQTFGYALYLLVQIVHLVVSFSTKEAKSNIQQRTLAVVQMAVGLAVGCHYYSAVFHRAVIGEAPRANWKVHGVYATCFLAICLYARAARNKKAYDGGEDGKKN